MHQFIMDVWNGLDWPNLIGGSIIALIVGFISKRLYGWGSWWGHTTREAVKFARKEAAQRQYRDILSYRLDGNLLTFHIARKVLFILGLCTLLLVTIGFITVMVANSPEHIGFDAIAVRDPTGLVVIFAGTELLYGSAIGGAMSELWQTASS